MSTPSKLQLHHNSFMYIPFVNSDLRWRAYIRFAAGENDGRLSVMLNYCNRRTLMQWVQQLRSSSTWMVGRLTGIMCYYDCQVQQVGLRLNINVPDSTADLSERDRLELPFFAVFKSRPLEHFFREGDVVEIVSWNSSGDRLYTTGGDRYEPSELVALEDAVTPEVFKMIQSRGWDVSGGEV